MYAALSEDTKQELSSTFVDINGAGTNFKEMLTIQ